MCFAISAVQAGVKVKWPRDAYEWEKVAGVPAQNIFSEGKKVFREVKKQFKKLKEKKDEERKD